MLFLSKEKMVQVIPFNKNHIPYIWEILKNYPDYFPDDFRINNYSRFEKYFENKEGLIVLKDKTIIGYGYIENIHDKMGCVAFFTKRKSLKPYETVVIIKRCLPYFFEKFNLDMIYAITKITNKACIKLMRKIGFKGFKVLENYHTVNGKSTDYLLSGILRKEVYKWAEAEA